MTFLALHRGPDTALGTTRWLLSAEEATACDSAVALLERLQVLLESQQARQEADNARARAEGYAAGRQEAVGQLAPRWLQAWQQAAAESAVQAEALRRAAGMLACQIVGQIATELAPADVVAALVRQALATRLPPTRVIVRVHPEVAAAVGAVLAQAPDPAHATALAVQADASLGLLDGVVQTALGECVAGLQSQLDRIASRFAS